MKKQPIKIVRGNDIVLRATCYVRNEIGELEAIDLQGCDVSVSASMLQGGVTDIPYSIVDSNTLELDCKAEVFPVLGSYSIDIRIVKDAQNVRFATRAAVQIVEYSNELYEVGECCDGEYSVVSIPDQIACTGPVKYALHVGVKNGESNFGEVIDALTERVTDIEEKNAEQDEEIAGFGKQIEDIGEQIAPMLNQLNSALGDVINEVGEQGEAIDTLLDKAKNYYEVKEYADYAGYNADTSRPSNTISLIQQNQSVVVGGKRYSQNAECYVGSNTSGISTTGNWFLCGEATITNARDVNIMGIVQQTVASGACGIFVLGLRGYSESASKFNFSWICKTSGAVPLLRVVINGHTVMLYCKVYGGQYQYAHIRLLNQCNQYESKSYKTSFFTLKDSITAISDADMPSGTDIADVPYLLKDGTAANSKRVDMSTTTDNAERRVLFGHDYNANGVGDIFKSPDLTYNPSTKTLTVPHVSGNSATATKLQTARKIGFANFDGSANISLNTIQGAFNVKWTTNTTQWQRVVRFKTKAAYTKRNILIAVQDIESLHFSGILKFDVGTIANTTSIICSVQWVALSNRVYENIDFFRVHKINPTESDEYLYIDLYANSPYQYTSMNFSILAINNTEGVTLGGSGEWLEVSAIPGTFLSFSKGVYSTDSAFLQSLDGLSHKSVDSSLTLQRRTEYICGQQALSDTEEAGKAFYGSSANPLVISVPLKDPADAVAGGKVNVNLIRYYYTETYWQELFFCVNSPDIYTRWVANGNARPWYRMMKEDSTIEYNAWVTKATKLATVHKIGFAGFNGDQDISLHFMQGGFWLRWVDNTTQWQRVARFRTSATNQRRIATIAVGDNESLSFQGVLRLGIAVLNTSSVSVALDWLALSNSTITKDFRKIFRAYITYPTADDKNVYVDIYANSPMNHVTMIFSILGISNQADFTFGGDGVWLEESAIPGVLMKTSTYREFDEIDAIKARLEALEAKTTTES